VNTIQGLGVSRMPDRSSQRNPAVLKTGDRLLLTVPGIFAAHSRVKTVFNDGVLQVTYAGHVRPVAGEEIEVKTEGGAIRKIYYLQVKDSGGGKHPYLLLQRNPGNKVNKRRRGFRIPYRSKTAIRGQVDRHFRSAVFYDLSLISARLASEYPYPPETSVVLRLNLPGFPEHEVGGKVIRVSNTPVCSDFFGQDLYGLVVIFEHLSLSASRHLTLFLWNYLRLNYQSQMRLLFDIGHSRQYGD